LVLVDNKRLLRYATGLTFADYKQHHPTICTPKSASDYDAIDGVSYHCNLPWI
jgi:hypothetical protein